MNVLMEQYKTLKQTAYDKAIDNQELNGGYFEPIEDSDYPSIETIVKSKIYETADEIFQGKDFFENHSWYLEKETGDLFVRGIGEGLPLAHIDELGKNTISEEDLIATTWGKEIKLEEKNKIFKNDTEDISHKEIQELKENRVSLAGDVLNLELDASNLLEKLQFSENEIKRLKDENIHLKKIIEKQNSIKDTKKLNLTIYTVPENEESIQTLNYFKDKGIEFNEVSFSEKNEAVFQWKKHLKKNEYKVAPIIEYKFHEYSSKTGIIWDSISNGYFLELQGGSTTVSGFQPKIFEEIVVLEKKALANNKPIDMTMNLTKGKER